MCACDWNWTCQLCAPAGRYDDSSYMTPDELERLRREHQLSTPDFTSPFKEAA